jgi:hypothetical protein
MTILVKLEVSNISKKVTFDLDDLEVTKEEWEKMSDKEKYDAIQKAVDDLPEQPYWTVEYFYQK